MRHQDGHSQLVATTVPTLEVYDPAYGYELAVIVQDGLRRMYADGETLLYYLTLYNESYEMPAMPEDATEGILKGMYRVSSIGDGEAQSQRPQLFGSGTILKEVLEAQKWLADEYDIATDVWSVTSYCRLRRDARAADRQNRLQPDGDLQRSYLTVALDGCSGPFVAATDYVSLVPDQIAPWIPGRYATLGTEGFGRSDTRSALREHFEVDAQHITFATLSALAAEEQFDTKRLPEAAKDLEINPDKIDPATA